MKLLSAFAAFILLVGVVKVISCKKEYSCENCREANKAPVAIAGNDTTIVLPIDSVILDGSASSDADGFINKWLWTRIAGPAVDIANSKNSIACVKNLAAGSYQFELRVTDNGGLSAKDTISVIVDKAKNPPVARAGEDQTISLPIDYTVLDGTASTDPDHNINSYTWTKIAGPASFVVSNSNATKTTVHNLVAGVYKFQLTVTDVDGLFSMDTTHVTVLK